MTPEEEQAIRERCREAWKLNKDQEDWYIAKVKAAREDIANKKLATEYPVTK